MKTLRRDPFVERGGWRRILRWAVRLLLLLITMTACATSGLLVYARWQSARQEGRIVVEGGDPALSVAERFYLQTYLAARNDALSAPIGGAQQNVAFAITAGERADQVAANLQAAGLLNDPALFLNYLRYYGLDARLEAGQFQLSGSLTTPELAATLINAVAQEVELRFLEGWRSEEMAAYLRATQPANIDGDAFLALVSRQAAFDLSAHTFLASLAPDVSLEGFLFPDTYRVPLDADAAYLLDLMLGTFGERVTPEMRQQFGVNGLSVRQAVTLASIVERETPLADERPLVAGVFYNRLARSMSLDADPTVQYAVGYVAERDSWWKSPLTLDDLQTDSPYNTYLYPGLPPGPIANPGLDALAAVAAPIQSEFIFFVADCSGQNPGAHLFSVTYEEHLAKVQACR
jgi:UPF0755 protein